MNGENYKGTDITPGRATPVKAATAAEVEVVRDVVEDLRRILQSPIEGHANRLDLIDSRMASQTVHPGTHNALAAKVDGILTRIDTGAANGFARRDYIHRIEKEIRTDFADADEHLEGCLVELEARIKRVEAVNRTFVPPMAWRDAEHTPEGAKHVEPDGTTYVFRDGEWTRAALGLSKSTPVDDIEIVLDIVNAIRPADFRDADAHRDHSLAELRTRVGRVAIAIRDLDDLRRENTNVKKHLAEKIMTGRELTNELAVGVTLDGRAEERIRKDVQGAHDELWDAVRTERSARQALDAETNRRISALVDDVTNLRAKAAVPDGWKDAPPQPYTMDDAVKEIADLREQLAQKTGEFEVALEIADVRKKERNEARRERDTWQHRVESVEAERDEADADAKARIVERDMANERVAKLEQERAEDIEDRAAMSERMAEMSMHGAKQDAKLAQFEHDTQSRIELIGELRDQLAATAKDRDAAKGAAAAERDLREQAERERDTHKRRYDSMVSEYNELAQRHQRTKNSLERAEIHLSAYKDKYDEPGVPSPDGRTPTHGATGA